MRADKKTILVLTVVFLVIGAVFITMNGFRIQMPAVVHAADGDKPEAEAPPAEEGRADEKKDPKQAGQPKPCPECPECPDVAKVVLRGLEEKKQSVAQAAKELEQQKKELELYEAQIDEKLTQLAALKTQIQEEMASLEAKKSQQELEKEAAFENKMARLVKMYAGMKPKDAAQIVDKLELEVAQEIFLRMREAPASQILSFVESEKAAKISERLAFKKK